MHVYLDSEEDEKELVNHNLIDPTDYDSDADILTDPLMRLTVTQLWHSFSGFDALLSFDYTTPVPSWVMTQNTGPHVDFRHFGGLADRYQGVENKDGTNRQGVILLSTSGFITPGARGSLIVELRKNKK